MSEQGAFGFGLPRATWRPPEELPPLPRGLDLGLDTETCDPLLYTLGPGWAWEGAGRVVGVSVATRELGACYLPIGHEGGDNLDEEVVREWLVDAIEAARRVICHNASYDAGWLHRLGVEVPAEKLHDTMLLEPLLNEHARGYSLDKTARRYGFNPKAEDVLKQAAVALGLGDHKKSLWRLPARYVGEYAEQDARLALELFHQQEPRMEHQGLGRVYELERSLVLPLNEIRRRGVRVDRDRAEQTLEDLRGRSRRYLADVKRLTGVRVNPWVPTSVAQALKVEGIDVPLTPKNRQPSVTKDYLESLDSRVAGLVREARRWDRAAETFVKGHVLAASELDGRVHPQLNQLMSDEGGTVSGRFSCSKPNLQQIPNRDREVREVVRALYLPEEGQQWAVLDYSQQEPRLTVHWASRAGVRGADEAVRKYHEDPDMSYHRLVADLTGLEYKAAKQLNLGMSYGMGGAKLCKSLGLPTTTTSFFNDEGEEEVYEVAGEEGQRMIDRYHQNVPFVRGLSELAQARARRRGYIKTILGRRCRFPDKRDLRKAMNRLIQGSAADQTKLALKLMIDEGLHVLTTVHDEVDLSFRCAAEINKGRELMEHALELRVPSRVDVEVGPTWGEVKELRDVVG